MRFKLLDICRDIFVLGSLGLLTGACSEVGKGFYNEFDSDFPVITMNLKGRTFFKASEQVAIPVTVIDNHRSDKVLIFVKEGNSDKFILQGHAPLPSDGKTEVIWTTPGREMSGIKVRIAHIDIAGNMGAVDSDDLSIDAMPPIVALYLGAENKPDTCTNPPVTHEAVATRLTPFAYCASDARPSDSGVSHLCNKKGISPSVPEDTDPCWKTKSDFHALTLLDIKSDNKITFFARDLAGNVGKAIDTITLDLNAPPKIEILTSNESMAKAPWQAGETHHITWRASDLNGDPESDTPYDQLKFIVTLREEGAQTKFMHLACNFKHTELWKQCPDASIENSPLITKIGSDKGSFKFVVPSFWDLSKTYLLLVTVIDKSGNAMISSPQALNKRAFTVAGTTYKGFGGSGTRTERSGVYAFLTTDKLGTLRDTTNNLEIAPFDRRTCRMIGVSAADVTPFDCPDKIATPYSVLNHAWVYNPHKDVFYTAGHLGTNEYLLELNFNTQTATPIFGEPSKEAISDALSSDSKAVEYKARNLSSKIAYDSANRKLLFFDSNQLFAISEDGGLSYVMGVLNGTRWPSEQTTVKQRDLVLPILATAFSVSKDGRLILGGEALATTPKGSGFALQYIVTDISYANPNALTNLVKISSSTNSSNEPSTGYLTQASYDGDKDRWFAPIAWWGIAEMKLPPKGSLASSYQWSYLLRYDPSKLDEKDFLVRQTSNPSTPPAFYFWSYGLAYPGSDYLYITNRRTGSILSFDLSTKLLSMEVGDLMTGNETDQMAPHRNLVKPLSLFSLNGDLYFNDFYNLQKIELSASVQENATIKTVVKDFPNFPLRYEAGTQTLFQMARRSLKLYNMTDPLNPTLEKTVTSNKVPYSYDNQFGLNNNLSHPKALHITSLYDSVKGLVHQTFLVGTDFGLRSGWPAKSNVAFKNDAVLSVPDLFNIRSETYCNGGPCTQGPLVDGKYYNLNQFRLTNGGGAWLDKGGHDVGMIAFDQAETAAYGCLNDQPSKINLTMGRVYPFLAKTSGGTLVGCKSGTSVFKYVEENGVGKIYFTGLNIARTTYDNIYQLDISTVENNGLATATPLISQGDSISGTYGDFTLTSEFVYYTVRDNNGLVVRNDRD